MTNRRIFAWIHLSIKSSINPFLHAHHPLLSHYKSRVQCIQSSGTFHPTGEIKRNNLQWRVSFIKLETPYFPNREEQESIPTHIL